MNNFWATVFWTRKSYVSGNYFNSETLAETIESDPQCITDLFQNKSVAYFLFIITFLQIFLYVS